MRDKILTKVINASNEIMALTHTTLRSDGGYDHGIRTKNGDIRCGLTAESFDLSEKDRETFDKNIAILIAYADKVATEYRVHNRLNFMLPPWVVFPTYSETTLGWRMGIGETYGEVFFDFCEDLKNKGIDPTDFYKEYPCPEYMFKRFNEFQHEVKETYPYARRIKLCLNAEMRSDVHAYISRRNSINSKFSRIVTLLISAAIVILSAILIFYITTRRPEVFVFVGIAFGMLLFIAGVSIDFSNFCGGKYSAVRQLTMEYGNSDICNILEELSDIPASGWDVLILDNRMYEYDDEEDLIYSGKLDSQDIEVLRDNPDNTEFYITWPEDKKNWCLAATPKKDPC